MTSRLAPMTELGSCVAPVCVALQPVHREQLAVFFQDLHRAGLEDFFHPHPLNGQAASALCTYAGLDFYGVLLSGGRVIGYGMLRGWDEGYAIPSLGIAIHPLFQGQGYGRLLIQFLHGIARARGAEKLRLKVNCKNLSALSLYQSEGYVFQDAVEDEMVGVLVLT